MELEDLEIFLETARSGSLSKAARRFGLSQPTISRRIQRLEADLAQLLFDRSLRLLTPTRAGLAVLRFAESVRADRRRLERELALPPDGLDVAASSTPAERLVPELLAGFARLHPDLERRLYVMDSRLVEACVVTGRCEVGFMGCPPRPGLLSQEVVAKDEIRLAVPEGHRLYGRGQVALSEVLDEPFVWREAGSGTRQTVEEALAAAGVLVQGLRLVAQASTARALVHAVRRGQGLGFVSASLLDGVPGVGAVAVEGLDLARPLFLVYRERHRSPAAQAFLDFVQASARESGD